MGFHCVDLPAIDYNKQYIGVEIIKERSERREKKKKKDKDKANDNHLDFDSIKRSLATPSNKRQHAEINYNDEEEETEREVAWKAEGRASPLCKHPWSFLPMRNTDEVDDPALRAGHRSVPSSLTCRQRF